PLTDDLREVGMLAEGRRVADCATVTLSQLAAQAHLGGGDRLRGVTLCREQRHKRDVVALEGFGHLMEGGRFFSERGSHFVGDVKRAQLINLLPDDSGGFGADMRAMPGEDEGSSRHDYSSLS